MYVCAGSVSGIWRSWAQQRNIQAFCPVQCSDGIALRCRQHIIVQQQCSGIQERGRQRHSRGCSSSRRMSHLTVCTVLSVLKLSALLQCTVLSALLQCTVLSTTQAVCFVTVQPVPSQLLCLQCIDAVYSKVQLKCTALQLITYLVSTLKSKAHITWVCATKVHSVKYKIMKNISHICAEHKAGSISDEAGIRRPQHSISWLRGEGKGVITGMKL